MSRFSGKCDLYDSLIDIHGVTDDTDWSKIRIYHKDELLIISSVRDLIPYSAYIIGVATSSNGYYSATISDESLVDSEEHVILDFYLKYAKRIYNRCKRKHLEFNVEEAIHEMSVFGVGRPYLKTICERVKEHPVSAKIDGIHIESYDRLRKELYDEMLKYGYDKDYAKVWCFGERDHYDL